MNYILTEDEQSGLKFWEAVVRAVNADIKVDTSAGKDKMFKKLKELNLSKGDNVLIAIDNIGDAVANEISNIINYCKMMQIRVEFTDYYCIEEMFISYTKWNTRCKEEPDSNGVNIEERNCYNAFKAIQDCIKQNKEYNPILMPQCKAFLIDQNIQNKSKEHILSKLLSKYTAKSVYGLRVKKISECWLNDCCYINNESDGKKYFCNQHKYINQKETLKEKIKDLGYNSILYIELHKIRQMKQSSNM